MSRSRRRRTPLEDHDWTHWILNHVWDRTPRNEVTHERFVQLEALAKTFMAEHPEAVDTAIAEARLNSEQPGLEEVFEVLHPVLKKYAAEHGVELVDFDPSPY